MACTVVAMGALYSSGITLVHASSVSFTDATGDVLDPLLTQNRLVAVPSSTPRGYADITNTSVNAAGGDVSFAVTTATAVPTFPQTNGDTGIEYNACFDVPSAENISKGPVQVGTGHHGAPIFDGPYNSSYGWKVCAWYSAQAGGLANITDYGVSIFDPVGQYLFFDKAQLTNVVAASYSGTTATFHFPYTWITTLPPPAPPEQGIARTESRTFLATGESANNLTISAQVYAGVTSPIGPTPNLPILGSINGVGGLLTTVDWSPGRQVCSTAVVSCTNDDGGSGKGNGYDLGLVPVGYPFGAAQDCDPNNLLASCPVPSTTGANGQPPTLGTVNYNLCFPGPGTNTTQDTGDGYALLGAACPNPTNVPWPYEYHTVNGRTLVPNTPQYTADSASFTG
jgi:hypothetical protein